MFVENIDNALKIIDFEINDDDRTNFYTFIFRTHYNCDLPYDHHEYRPLKYFKLLYKMIKDYL